MQAALAPHTAARSAPWTVALVGNPNCGKTALFNLLTGARQKVANYAGVTVERKEGQARLADGTPLAVLDLPGAYSLTPATPDEQVMRDVLLGVRAGEALPDVLVAVVDATNMRMNLRLVLELKALGRPLVVALNMVDVARSNAWRLTWRACKPSWAVQWWRPSRCGARAMRLCCSNCKPCCRVCHLQYPQSPLAQRLRLVRREQAPRPPLATCSAKYAAYLRWWRLWHHSARAFSTG